MQFFIISPLLLLPMLHYGKKISYILLPVITTLFIINTMVLFNIYNIVMYRPIIPTPPKNVVCANLFFRWSENYYQLYYYASHNRLPAWLIGIIFGAFLIDYQNNKNKFQIRRKVLLNVAKTNN